MHQSGKSSFLSANHGQTTANTRTSIPLGLGPRDPCFKKGAHDNAQNVWFGQGRHLHKGKGGSKRRPELIGSISVVPQGTEQTPVCPAAAFATTSSLVPSPAASLAATLMPAKTRRGGLTQGPPDILLGVGGRIEPL